MFLSLTYNGTHIGVVRIIKTKYMNEEEIRDEARKAANRSQFMSNHIYDHKSYKDGFFEGMNQALRQYGVMQQSEQLVCDKCVDGLNKSKSFEKGTCVHCRKKV